MIMQCFLLSEFWEWTITQKKKKKLLLESLQVVAKIFTSHNNDGELVNW